MYMMLVQIEEMNNIMMIVWNTLLMLAKPPGNVFRFEGNISLGTG